MITDRKLSGAKNPYQRSRAYSTPLRGSPVPRTDSTPTLAVDTKSDANHVALILIKSLGSTPSYYIESCSLFLLLLKPY